MTDALDVKLFMAGLVGLRDPIGFETTTPQDGTMYFSSVECECYRTAMAKPNIVHIDIWPQSDECFYFYPIRCVEIVERARLSGRLYGKSYRWALREMRRWDRKAGCAGRI